MKNLPLAEEAERWKRLCLQELGGLKRLRRKGREPSKTLLRRTWRQDPQESRPHVQPGGSCSGSTVTPEPSEGGTGQVRAAYVEGLHLQQHPKKAPQQQQHPSSSPLDTCLRAGCLNGEEGAQQGRGFPVDPRVVGGPQQQPHLESPYSSDPQAIYPGSSPSPRRHRLGEAAGVPSEIKAIQQTRRLLANARERTRVHTISAAFEALRKQVPCYSYGQKLSKLAILRIACNYILSLAKLADLDYSADHSNMSFSECVEQCTRTLQAEGRSKKRKE